MPTGAPTSRNGRGSRSSLHAPSAVNSASTLDLPAPSVSGRAAAPAAPSLQRRLAPPCLAVVALAVCTALAAALALGSAWHDARLSRRELGIARDLRGQHLENLLPGGGTLYQTRSFPGIRAGEGPRSSTGGSSSSSATTASTSSVSSGTDDSTSTAGGSKGGLGSSAQPHGAGVHRGSSNKEASGGSDAEARLAASSPAGAHAQGAAVDSLLQRGLPAATAPGGHMPTAMLRGTPSGPLVPPGGKQIALPRTSASADGTSVSGTGSGTDAISVLTLAAEPLVGLGSGGNVMAANNSSRTSAKVLRADQLKQGVTLGTVTPAGPAAPPGPVPSAAKSPLPTARSTLKPDGAAAQQPMASASAEGHTASMEARQALRQAGPGIGTADVMLGQTKVPTSGALSEATGGRPAVLPTQELSGAVPLKYPVWWFAPFWSGTGYSSEANNYVLSLLRSKLLRRQDVWVSHHGDHVREQVVHSMDEQDRSDLQGMEKGADSRPAIVLCHSLPTNWMFPEPLGWAGAQCPPDPTKHGFVYLIGRTMFETDRLPQVFVPRCNAMNEVWVPSEFSRDVFIRSGVQASKIVVVPEGVNTTWFDPALYEPAQFPKGDLVFGHAPAMEPARPTSVPPAADAATAQGRAAAASRASAAADSNGGAKVTSGSMHAPASAAAAGASGGQAEPAANVSVVPLQPPPFRFLSTFKWEPRKGWDVLLEAYLSEFTAKDNVELYIITKPFVGGADFKRYMHLWVARRAAQRRALNPSLRLEPVNNTAQARLYVIHQHISDQDFPGYYKAADCFVLPSRGEGWGRPHVEAMSMGLPIISTNWSGITAYLDDTVGYPLQYDGLVTVNDNSVWWFKGLKWAQPSVTHLRKLMRHVYNNREEAHAKGVLARQRMVKQFSPDVLARQVAAELRRIETLIPDLS